MLERGHGVLNDLCDADRARALQRFQVIRPFLEEGMPLHLVAQGAGISLRTAKYWVGRYRQAGLVGLARKGRIDRNRSRVSTALWQAIEGTALQTPRLSAATIHRKAMAVAKKLEEHAPSYTRGRLLSDDCIL